MDNIMELLYNEPLGNWRAGTHPQDSEFVRTAQIKSANLNMLMDSLSDEQKEWFEGYSQADTKLEDGMHFNNFCYAFHLGAMLMEELLRGKGEMLK